MDFSSYTNRLPDLSKGAVAGAAIAMIIGFQWGGWTLGSTAANQGAGRRTGRHRERAGADLRRQVPERRHQDAGTNLAACSIRPTRGSAAT